MSTHAFGTNNTDPRASDADNDARGTDLRETSREFQAINASRRGGPHRGNSSEVLVQDTSPLYWLAAAAQQAQDRIEQSNLYDTNDHGESGARVDETVAHDINSRRLSRVIWPGEPAPSNSMVASSSLAGLSPRIPGPDGLPINSGRLVAHLSLIGPTSPNTGYIDPTFLDISRTKSPSHPHRLVAAAAASPQPADRPSLSVMWSSMGTEQSPLSPSPNKGDSPPVRGTEGLFGLYGAEFFMPSIIDTMKELSDE
ncbi:hypothetical protein B0T26DRAFT_187267 [Lasiosphaeria miniovina]|uniref:Uncharacterized protein n=1 Tax=Lasiosphaeria miniovina TaxID=1954250 RepID=A0AA40B783_9PEZI|nr:uncharacterized protein B0T26DRAFT_187267 [Lasiosphaeria miniovina]KAK0728904.1 hypothetical protein B0T26DRAFT_187267 [Lasiosphaeria miniovina]